jgi:hypothetical protein
MGSFAADFRNLCTPAMFYFIISMISLVLIVIQNLSSVSGQHFRMGEFSCRVPHTGAFLVAKLVYILFWTWVLNLICRDGHKTISWLLVFLPYILFFVLIGLIMINQR